MKITSVSERVAIPVSLALVAVVSVFSRLLAGPAALASFDDDFFYYLKVAGELAAGRGSTFDGIHATNGYHPLWMLLLSGLSKLLPQSAVLIAVLCLVVLSVLLTYWGLLRCFRQPTARNSSAELIAAAIAFGCLFLARGGMEIVLAIPCIALLCCFRVRPTFRWSAGCTLLYGLLGACAVLCRLDAILLVAPLFLLEVVQLRLQGLRLWRRAATGLLCGLLPLQIYASINQHFFRMVLPVSGEAKQLRMHRGISIVPFKSLVHGFTPYTHAVVVAPSLVVLGFAGWRLARNGFGRLPRQQRPLAVALMTFPLLQISVLSVVSDWPLWPWYLYSLIVSDMGSAFVLLHQEFSLAPKRKRQLTWASTWGLLLIGSSYAAGRVHSSMLIQGPMYAMYRAAVAVQGFSEQHPGVYAMGDRAGMPGYLMTDPLLQTEGLVMDKAYLENIRTEQPLLEVLHRYGVTYLITTNPPLKNGCYLIREPMQAGPDSHAMRARICHLPQQRFVENGIETDIFDVRLPH